MGWTNFSMSDRWWRIPQRFVHLFILPHHVALLPLDANGPPTILFIDALNVDVLTNDAHTGNALTIDDDSDEDVLNFHSMFNDIMRVKIIWIKSI